MQVAQTFHSRKITLPTQDVEIAYEKQVYEIKKDEKEIGGIRMLGVNMM